MSYTLDFPIQYISNPDRFGAIGLGKLYIGVVDGDPAFEPDDRIQVYIARQNDTDLAIPQPIELSAGGVPVYLGSPVTLKINESFSCAVLDRNDQQVFYSPKAGEIIDEINSLEDLVNDFSDRSLFIIENVAALSTFAPVVGQVYYLKEYHSGTGKGGGDLLAKSGSITPNNVTTFASATAGVYFERIDYGTISVLHAGAIGDGVADDTAALMRAFTYINENGGSLRAPKGIYDYNDTLVLDTGVYTRGVIVFGDGRDSILRQSGAGKDAIHFSTTQFLQNSGIRDLKVENAANAGHLFNVVYGCTTCFVSNVDFVQNNPAKAIIYGDYTVTTGGIYDTKFSGGSWYLHPSSTEAGVRIRCGGTFFNENKFENLRAYYANTIQFFHIRAETGSDYWLYNNVIENINFEVCKGGGVLLSSANRCTVSNCSFWDAQGNYTNHLIDFTAGAGYESAANTIISTGRNGDALDAGVNDIRVVSGQDLTVVNCYTQAGDNPRYDFNSKRVTWFGLRVGTFNNTAGLIALDSNQGLRFPGTVNGIPLNYYDEGAWTGVLDGSGSAPTTPVTASGLWTRKGREVTATIDFEGVATTGASGAVVVTGLPFPPVSSHHFYGAVRHDGFGTSPIVCRTDKAATQVRFYNAASGAVIVYGAGTGQFLSFTVSYFV